MPFLYILYHHYSSVHGCNKALIRTSTSANNALKVHDFPMFFVNVLNPNLSSANDLPQGFSTLQLSMQNKT